MNELMSLQSQLRYGVVLDRPQARTLLKQLSALETTAPGCAVMVAQLQSVLARKDWLKISIVADLATVRETGVNIGIAQAKPGREPRPTPMQRWQHGKGLRR